MKFSSIRYSGWGLYNRYAKYLRLGASEWNVEKLQAAGLEVSPLLQKDTWRHYDAFFEKCGKNGHGDMYPAGDGRYQNDDGGRFAMSQGAAAFR